MKEPSIKSSVKPSVHEEEEIAPSEASTEDGVGRAAKMPKAHEMDFGDDAISLNNGI